MPPFPVDMWATAIWRVAFVWPSTWMRPPSMPIQMASPPVVIGMASLTLPARSMTALGARGREDGRGMPPVGEAAGVEAAGEAAGVEAAGGPTFAVGRMAK